MCLKNGELTEFKPDESRRLYDGYSFYDGIKSGLTGTYTEIAGMSVLDASWTVKGMKTYAAE